MNQEQSAPELRPQLVTIEELINKFDPPVSRGTAYMWKAQDIIRPARKEGRTYLYDLEACLAALAGRKGRSSAAKRQAATAAPTRSNNFEPLYAGEREVKELQKGPPPPADSDEHSRPENVIAQNFPDTFRDLAPKLPQAFPKEFIQEAQKITAFNPPHPAFTMAKIEAPSVLESISEEKLRRTLGEPTPAAPVATRKSIEAGVPPPRERDHSTAFLCLLARRAKEHQARGELEAENALLWALVEAGGFGGGL